MNSTVRNILAVLAGLAIGSFVNMGIVMVSSSIIPLPDGVNPSDPESLKAAMPLFEPKHFLFPFLAHALGTLVGALVAAKISAAPLRGALLVGGIFAIGGAMMIRMMPSPLWFSLTDLLLAYLPMAWIGYKISGR